MPELVTPAAMTSPSGRPASDGIAVAGRDNGCHRAARLLARVLVADRQPMVRRGIRSVIDLERDLTVAAEAGSPREVMEAASRIRPEVIVTDIDFGVQRGPRLDLIRALRLRHRSTRIMVFTGRRDRATTAELMRLGVHGYLDKQTDPDQLPPAIHALLDGRAVFDSGATSALATHDIGADVVVDTPEPPRLDTAPLITHREHDVLTLMVVGLSNREIGEKLGVTEATVKFHVRNLQNKLNVRGRMKIAYVAVRHGLI